MAHSWKLFFGIAFFVASLWGVKWGVKHAKVGPDSPTRSRLMRVMRLFGIGSEPGSDGPSKCHDCLAEGKDFCIAANKCIPRATFECRGPHDHITGDKEFALHGNPEGIQHSMVCPEAKKDSYLDQKDCYFDEECHAKVDWKKIGEVKGGFFARLKYFKEKKDASKVKVMMGNVHEVFHKAGMPEDRIDYIIEKWVKSVYPEALEGPQDPSSGKEEKPHFTMCDIAEKRCMKDGEKILKGRCGVQWKACEHQWKEKKNADASQDEDVHVKDCYFDKECHAKVDWEKIGKIKEGFFARLKVYKTKQDTGAVNEMMAKVHVMFREAGMPDDRIDYILVKWVKYVYPEALQDVSITV